MDYVKLLDKDDIASISGCLESCKQCSSWDCAHCPIRVEPSRLLKLAYGYDYIMTLLNDLTGGYK